MAGAAPHSCQVKRANGRPPDTNPTWPKRTHQETQNRQIVRWKQEKALDQASPLAHCGSSLSVCFDFWHFCPPSHTHSPSSSTAFRTLDKPALWFRPCLLLQYLSTGEKSIHVQRTFLSTFTPANSRCLETSLIKTQYTFKMKTQSTLVHGELQTTNTNLFCQGTQYLLFL